MLAAFLTSPASAGAFGGCPQQAAAAPRPSTASLAVGMSVIGDEGLESSSFGGLRPPSGAPMGVHLYVGYQDPDLSVRLAPIRAYHAAGYRTLLTIKANAGTGVLTPQLYSAYVTQILSQTAGTLDAVEITNEGNVPGSPETSDGSNPSIIEDLVAGVQTAKSYALGHRLNLSVGFNWAFDYHLNLNDFWQQLKLDATPQFLRSVDFLGLHTYPNFASAATTVDGSINRGEIDALQTARCEMADVGLTSNVPIDITEVGYPVPNPSYLAAQGDYWARVLDTIYAYRANDGIRSVYVFRYPGIATAASADFGIVNANGTPRPSYDVIRDRIAQFDPAPPNRFRSPTKNAPLIRLLKRVGGELFIAVRRPAHIIIFIGDRRLEKFRPRPGRTYRISLRDRHGRVRVTASADRRREVVILAFH
jgi:hypothetical protein